MYGHLKYIYMTCFRAQAAKMWGCLLIAIVLLFNVEQAGAQGKEN